MRAYLITTAVIFALIIIAHVARLLTHELGVATEPAFLVSSSVSVGMLIWALVLIRNERN